MFDFLKPKAKMTPEKLGEGLALAFGELFLPKMQKYVLEFRGFPEMTNPRIDKLFDLYLIYWSTQISLEIEYSGIVSDQSQRVLDYFWNYIPKILEEGFSANKVYAEKVSLEFKENTSSLYPQVRNLIISPSDSDTVFTTKFLALGMPDFDITNENYDLILKLAGDLVAIQAGTEEFIAKTLKKTTLT